MTLTRKTIDQGLRSPVYLIALHAKCWLDLTIGSRDSPQIFLVGHNAGRLHYETVAAKIPQPALHHLRTTRITCV